jgi:NADH-quinone oxidoreductase subunit L
MLVPIGVLAVGSIASGLPFKELFVGPHGVEEFFRDSVKMNPHILEGMEQMPWLVGQLPTLMMIIGAVIAYVFYISRPYLPEDLAEQQPMLYQFLLNKWYFDELYDWLIVRPAMALGFEFWKKGDGAVIDGLGPDGLAATTTRLSIRASLLQTGYLYHYAFVMLIGVVLLVSWYLLRQIL